MISRRNFRRNRKGIGTIFGMVFFLLIVMIVFASFMVLLTKNTGLEQTIIQTRQMDLDIASEHLLILNPVYSPAPHTFSCSIQNSGAITVQVVRLWIQSATGQLSSYPISPAITVPQGQTKDCPETFATDIQPNLNPGGFWLVTARGNRFTYGEGMGPQGPPGPAGQDGTTTNALVSQGIGYIAMDFNTFSHYEFTSDQNGKTITVSPTTSYTIGSGASYLLFHVVLTNADPNNDITLNHLSDVYILGSNQGGGSVKYVTWTLATLDPNTHVLNAIPADYSVTLHKNNADWVDVYFYGSIPSGNNKIAPGLYPMNIMLFGLRGTNAYGQNLPFVALYFS